MADRDKHVGIAAGEHLSNFLLAAEHPNPHRFQFPLGPHSSFLFILAHPLQRCFLRRLALSVFSFLCRSLHAIQTTFICWLVRFLYLLTRDTKPPAKSRISWYEWCPFREELLSASCPCLTFYQIQTVSRKFIESHEYCTFFFFFSSQVCHMILFRNRYIFFPIFGCSFWNWFSEAFHDFNVFLGIYIFLPESMFKFEPNEFYWV